MVSLSFRTIPVFAAAFLSAVLAFPSAQIQRRQSITALTSAQISAFKPYSFYAAAAYCNPSVTATWTCGTNCNANPGFKPVASGGDGDETQFC